MNSSTGPRTKGSREAAQHVGVNSVLAPWPWLFQQWFGLNDKCGIPWQTAERHASILVSQYQAEGRHYHNLAHIETCLLLLEQYVDIRDLPSRQHVWLSWAFWFHDCVDDRFDKEGVPKSADAAVAYLSTYAMQSEVFVPETGIAAAPPFQVLGGGNGACDRLCASVRGLILATDYRYSGMPVLSEKEAMLSDLTEDHVALMRDIDLSTLGASAEVYAVYADSIRKEYAHVEMAAYQTGRAKVLKHFLEMSPIYHTAWFYDRFETLARANLSSELSSLLLIE